MILITGATGRTGIDVVKSLLEKDQSVTALVRDKARARRVAELGVGLIEGDISDPASWDGLFDGVDRVFLLSPESPEMPEHHGKFDEREPGLI